MTSAWVLVVAVLLESLLSFTGARVRPVAVYATVTGRLIKNPVTVQNCGTNSHDVLCQATLRCFAHFGSFNSEPSVKAVNYGCLIVLVAR